MSDLDVSSALEVLAGRLVEGAQGRHLALIGIRRRGDEVAERLGAVLRERGVAFDFGVLDVSLYRDDLGEMDENPRLESSEIDFAVDGAEVVLVDDVLFTGRTIRAAMDALTDYGRPRTIELAVLVDRGHREFPIQPDYVGLVLETSREDRVAVKLEKTDGEDGLMVVKAGA